MASSLIFWAVVINPSTWARRVISWRVSVSFKLFRPIWAYLNICLILWTWTVMEGRWPIACCTETSVDLRHRLVFFVQCRLIFICCLNWQEYCGQGQPVVFSEKFWPVLVGANNTEVILNFKLLEMLAPEQPIKNKSSKPKKKLEVDTEWNKTFWYH